MNHYRKGPSAHLAAYLRYTGPSAHMLAISSNGRLRRRRSREVRVGCAVVAVERLAPGAVDDVTSSSRSLAMASTSAPTAALGATHTARPAVVRILRSTPSAPSSRGAIARTTTAAVSSPSSPCASTSRRRLLRRALPPVLRRAPRAPRPSASTQALCQRLRRPVPRRVPTLARRAPVGRGPCMARAKFESPHAAEGVRRVTFAGA